MTLAVGYFIFLVMKENDEKIHGPDEEPGNSAETETTEDTGMEADAYNKETYNEALDSEKANGNRSGSSRFFLKLALYVILAGGFGLGGFWCFTKINLGMKASETIGQLDLKISEVESNQAEILKTLQGIESRLDQPGKSDQTVSEILEKLNALGKGLADIKQTTLRVSQSITQLEKREASVSSGIPTGQEGPANLGDESQPISLDAQELIIKEGKNLPEPEITITPAQEKKEPQVETKEQLFENFVKFLLKNIGRGLKWSTEKLFFVVDELLKKVI